MKRGIFIWCMVPFLAASPSAGAEGYEFAVDSPKFRVTIPGIPQMKMAVHPKHATQPELRFQGSEDPYAVTVYTPAAPPGMTPLECASAISRVVAARPGTPPASEIVKARLDENTYVALYATPLVGGVQLHAHLLSAAGGTHCVEVHATRVSIEEDDLASWIADLENARIKSD